jgi:hypothetical protein
MAAPAEIAALTMGSGKKGREATVGKFHNYLECDLCDTDGRLAAPVFCLARATSLN